MLTFQRLDAYQIAVQFLALASEINDSLPRGNSDRIDQLNRSAESVLRNIAEGAGRWSAADAAKHYKIARGEAMECVASFDVLKIRNLIDVERYAKGIELLERIVATLTRLVEAEMKRLTTAST